jgi:hypothetical protein
VRKKSTFSGRALTATDEAGLDLERGPGVFRHIQSGEYIYSIRTILKRSNVAATNNMSVAAISLRRHFLVQTL